MIKIITKAKRLKIFKLLQEYDQNVLEFLATKKYVKYCSSLKDAFIIFCLRKRKKGKSKTNYDIDTSTNAKQAIYDLFENNIKSTSENLNIIINNFLKLDLAYQESLNRVLYFLNWPSFRQNNKKLFYRIFNILKIKTCPYCNTVEIELLKINSKKFSVADLDHYYNESKYPYIKLFFYNLIPSCNRCNSKLKLGYDNYNNPCLYPYREEFGDKAKFILKNSKFINKKDFNKIIINMLSGDNSFDLKNIKIGLTKNFTEIDKVKKINKKISNSIKVLKLLTVYNRKAIDELKLLIEFINYFKEDNLFSLKKIVNNKCLSPTDRKYLKCLKKKNDLIEPFSKFRRDLLSQFDDIDLLKLRAESN